MSGFLVGQFGFFVRALGFIRGACADCCLSFDHICGSDSTCNNYCTPSKKAFSRAHCDEECDCPCSGNRALPICFTASLSGITLKSDIAAGDGTTWDLSAAGDIELDNCTENYLVEFVAVHNDSDGNVIDTADMSVSGSVSVAITDECGKVAASYELQNNSQQGVFYDSSVYTNVGVGDGTTDACDGGEITDGPHRGPLDAPDLISVFDGAGILEVSPACTDCNGTSCGADEGDDASECASDITITIDVWTRTDLTEDDPPEEIQVYKHYEIHLTGGSCTWSGDGNDDAHAEISVLEGCNPDGDLDVPCEAANPVFEIKITVPEGELIYHTTGPCPEAGGYGAPFSTTVAAPVGVNPAQNMTLTFGSDC